MSIEVRVDAGVEPDAGSTPAFVHRLLSAATWPLLPLLLVQGAWLRRRVPRLPEAGGPCAGVAGEDGAPPLRLLVLGESTVAGVGVDSHERGLTGYLAREVARRAGRPVEWRAVGRNGATARTTLDELLPRVPPGAWDAAVVALGVNDVLRMRSPGRWAGDLEALLRAVRERTGAPRMVLAPVPPLERFPALPWPLRAILGARARLLDAAAQLVARRLGVVCSEWPGIPDPRQFCDDGIHPSEAGYAEWALLTADCLMPITPPAACAGTTDT